MADRRRTVLLFDDEALPRMAAADLLDDAGFHVVEAISADDALRILERDADSIDVLVTDVHMPGSMNGLGLATEVDRRWPRIVLVVMSGLARYSDRDVPDHGRFVAKPWRLPTMMAAIDAAGGTERPAL